jgi:hypothetical protein
MKRLLIGNLIMDVRSNAQAKSPDVIVGYIKLVKKYKF